MDAYPWYKAVLERENLIEIFKKILFNDYPEISLTSARASKMIMKTALANLCLETLFFLGLFIIVSQF